MHRTPDTKEALNILGIEAIGSLTTIVDIGVQYGTKYFINSCPQSKFYLVEPVALYYPEIEDNYKNLNYELIRAAATGCDCELYINNYCNSVAEPTKVTHSYVSSSPIPAQLERFHSSEKVPGYSINTLLKSFVKEIEPLSCCVKVDVDGIEDLIIDGWTEGFKFVSSFIVECTLDKISSRVKALNNKGFELFDICDPGYYFDKLTQVELIFVNADLKLKYPCLDPWGNVKGKLYPDKWQHNQ